MPPAGSRFGFVYRINRVPYYQRLFQRHDGIRQWNKTNRSKMLTYPFYASLATCGAASMYMMTRMVFAHKTWFGEG